MPSRKSLPLVLIFVVLTACACGDDPVTIDDDPAVRGRIVNSQGNPVSGAAILICYDAIPLSRGSSKDWQVISFCLPSAGPVRCWITETCGGQEVRLLVDGEMGAGAHELSWDGRNDDGLRLVSGLYVANLEVGGETLIKEIFLNIRSYAQYTSSADMESFAVTGSDGRFGFSQDCLPLGSEVQYNDEVGVSVTATISRNVTLWAIHDLYGAARTTAPVAIDSIGGASVVIEFGEANAARAYAAAHWSESRLACAFDVMCADESLAGVGVEFLEIHDYEDLPLWISPEVDEEEFLENIGRWNQFVFGWDDFLHPSEFTGGAYVPGDISALADPRVSAHREAYRALMDLDK